MQCPSCEEVELRPVFTKQGVEVDYCDCCHGVWLDRGELFQFAKDPKRVAQNLEEGLKHQKPIGKICPVTGEPMVEIAYPGGLRLDYCPKSQGIWFDAGELQNLLTEDPSLRLTLDRATLIPPTSEAGSFPPVDMIRLPNRFLSSLTVLIGMWGLFTAILIALAQFEIISVIAALIVGVMAALLQFLLAPFSLDLTLRWLFKFRWLTPEELPLHLRQFAEQLCQQQNIKFPYFGLIEDGAPQAFTYGHTPNNARVILSRGIMELLDEREVEAVVAHEVGHAVHWDMLLMTAAQIIPLVLYYFYRLLLDMATSTKSDAKIQARITVLLGAMGAFAVYILSEYLVLWFSRHREYYADWFSGEVTGSPGHLSSALVKIAYGLAGLEKKESEAEESTTRRAALASVKALGIFDDRMAQALAIAGYTPGLVATDQVDKANIKGAMRWDLWNPWARWYELNSTHPLVANRLQNLSDQSRMLNQEPYIVFSEAQPESYWDEFLLDLLIYLLPIVAVLLLIPLVLIWWAGLYPVPVAVLPGLLAIMGIGRLLRYFFSYQGKYFPGMSVAALLKRVKVSDIRPVPCTLQGTVIGRGVPGLIFSDDFVMRDETGIIFLDYRQPLAIWELLFGLLQAGSYNGKQVTVQGWYRRSPIPYVQIKTIECEGVVRKSYVPAVKRLTPFIYILAGLGWGAYLMF